MIEPERGSGRTKRQMAEAPPHATFVWCNNALWYAHDLARSIGREDLIIVPPSYLNSPRNLHPNRPSQIVIDHAAWLNERQRETLSIIIEWNGRLSAKNRTL